MQNRRESLVSFKEKNKRKFRTFIYKGDYARIECIKGKVSKIYRHITYENVFGLLFENAIRIDKNNRDPSFQIEPVQFKDLKRSFKLLKKFETMEEFELCDMLIERNKLAFEKRKLEEEIREYAMPSTYSLGSGPSYHFKTINI